MSDKLGMKSLLGKATKWDIQQAEKRIERKVQKLKSEAACNGSAMAMGLIYSVLLKEYNYSDEQLRDLHQHVDELSNQLNRGELFLDDIYEYLKEHGVTFEFIPYS